MSGHRRPPPAAPLLLVAAVIAAVLLAARGAHGTCMMSYEFKNQNLQFSSCRELRSQGAMLAWNFRADGGGDGGDGGLGGGSTGYGGPGNAGQGGQNGGYGQSGGYGQNGGYGQSGGNGQNGGYGIGNGQNGAGYNGDGQNAGGYAGNGQGWRGSNDGHSGGDGAPGGEGGGQGGVGGGKKDVGEFTAGNGQYRSLEILFSGTAPASGGWVGWGINPESPGQMAGTQAFIAFQAANGSTILTYDLTAATKQGAPLACSPISLLVSDMQVQITRGTAILIYVRLELPPGSPTVLNHVWNRGASVSNFRPSAHKFSPVDLSAFATIEMAGPPGYQFSAAPLQEGGPFSRLLILFTSLILVIFHSLRCRTTLVV